MSRVFVLLIMIVLYSCGKDDVQPVSSSVTTLKSASKSLVVIEEVEEIFNDMNEFIVVYVKEAPVDNVIFELTTEDSDPRLKGQARGLCDKSGTTPIIRLYFRDWQGQYKMDYLVRTASLYHLVGECVFNKPINNKTIPVRYHGADYGIPVSFMHENWGKWLYPEGRVTSAHIIDMKKEFFDYYGPL